MLIIVEDQLGTRLDQYLAAQLPELSRARIQALIKEGEITVNGRATKAKTPVERNMRIEVCIPEPEPAEAQPQDIPLSVLFEDKDVIVIDKESGMVVHPAAGNPDGTLVNAVLFHCGDLSGIGGVERPGIVHRLDKDTSGCIVVAKNDQAHLSLTTQFAERDTGKIYLAVVQGCPKEQKGTVFTNIGRHPVNRLKMAVVNPGSGKPAITDWEVLHYDAATDSSLVMCTLHTGRTHAPDPRPHAAPGAPAYRRSYLRPPPAPESPPGPPHAARLETGIQPPGKRAANCHPIPHSRRVHTLAHRP